MTLTVGSLFSGIGGIDLGLERAGMRVLWQCERDPYCRRVLAKHWPRVPCFEDVTLTDWSHVDRVDLVAGGFPCQPVSRAGRKLAQDDERWLWPYFAEVVRRVRPRFVLVENVPGLLVRGMGDVLGDLAALGFDAEWEGIPASSVGAPHHRDRVWIVAYTDRERLEERRSALAASPALSGPEHGGEVVDAGSGRHGAPEGPIFAGWDRPVDAGGWIVEPDVGRVAHGIPARVDRVRGLGNSVVPQVVEWIGRRVMEMAA